MTSINGRQLQAVSDGAGFSEPSATLLLDKLTSQPISFYSVSHKVRAAYAGAAFTVRRASDNATADIGFVNGIIDVAALDAHCGISDGFVTTWFDQKGSNNLTQSTAAAQPKVWNGSARSFAATTRTDGLGVPAFSYDGTDDQLGRADFYGLTGNPDLTIACALAMTATGAKVLHYFGDSLGGVGKYFQFYPSTDTATIVADGTGSRTWTATSVASFGRHVITRASGANMNASVWRQNGTALTQSASASNVPNIENEISVIGNLIACSMNCFGIWQADYSAGGNAADLATLESWMKSACRSAL